MTEQRWKTSSPPRDGGYLLTEDDTEVYYGPYGWQDTKGTKVPAPIKWKVSQ